MHVYERVFRVFQNRVDRVHSSRESFITTEGEILGLPENYTTKLTTGRGQIFDMGSTVPPCGRGSVQPLWDSTKGRYVKT